MARLIYSRRMYEAMAGWETAATDAGRPPLMRDFAEIWQYRTWY